MGKILEDEISRDNATEVHEKQAVLLYRHTKELAWMKYEQELERQTSLIQQSSQMQTVFSFMTAAAFMVLPVLLEYRGALSIRFVVTAITSIVACLLVSLVFASITQWRFKMEVLENVPELEQFVEENWKDSLKESQQLKQWVDVIGKMQVKLAEVNNKRVKCIQISMISFFISIGLVILCFILAATKIISMR